MGKKNTACLVRYLDNVSERTKDPRDLRAEDLWHAIMSVHDSRVASGSSALVDVTLIPKINA